MKHLLLLGIALCLCTTAHATFITYSYNSPIVNANGFHFATGMFTVDDQTRGLVDVTFNSDPFTFHWKGYVPLLNPQPVEDEGKLYQNGFETFVAGDIEFNLYLDVFYLNAGEDIFHNLHKTAPYEGAQIRDMSDNNTMWLTGGLTKLYTTEVNDPNLWILFSLGLAGLVYTRRQRLY